MAAVRRYDILDTPADGTFDTLTSLASRHFGVPIAIVSIVDSDRIWFKSHHGVDAQEIDRDRIGSKGRSTPPRHPALTVRPPPDQQLTRFDDPRDGPHARCHQLHEEPGVRRDECNLDSTTSFLCTGQRAHRTSGDVNGTGGKVIMRTAGNNRRIAASILLVILAACGTEPAESVGEATGPTESREASEPTEAGGATVSEPTEPPASIEALYEELDGLTGEERRDALVAMALAEDEQGEDFFLYTPLDPDELQPIFDGFVDDTGVAAPQLYQATASTLRERLLTEAAAGQVAGDVITGNSTEMLILGSEDVFAPLESPLVDELTRGVYENWVTIFFSAFIGAWNTNAASSTDVPDSWEAILTETENLAMGGGDYDFMATLIKDHFMAEQGMSEEEAIGVFREGACNATFVQGHTLQTQLMIAGEFDFGTSVYHHQIMDGIEEGAPLAWEPPIEPIVLVPNGVAVGRDTDRPATALLFVEHLLQDGQTIFAGLNRTPVDSNVEGGVPVDYATLILDEEAQVEERDKWDALYEELTQCSGQPVRE